MKVKAMFSYKQGDEVYLFDGLSPLPFKGATVEMVIDDSVMLAFSDTDLGKQLMPIREALRRVIGTTAYNNLRKSMPKPDGEEEDDVDTRAEQAYNPSSGDLVEIRIGRSRKWRNAAYYEYSRYFRSNVIFGLAQHRKRRSNKWLVRVAMMDGSVKEVACSTTVLHEAKFAEVPTAATQTLAKVFDFNSCRFIK